MANERKGRILWAIEGGDLHALEFLENPQKPTSAFEEMPTFKLAQFRRVPKYRREVAYQSGAEPSKESHFVRVDGNRPSRSWQRLRQEVEGAFSPIVASLSCLDCRGSIRTS